MPDPHLDLIQPWAPHPSAAPRTTREGDAYIVAGNGTRTCVGGWQAEYSGVRGGRTYQLQWDVRCTDIPHERDSLRCKVFWGEIAPDTVTAAGKVPGWDYLLPERTGPDTVTFRRTVKAPKGVENLTIRCSFRWTTEGESVWSAPHVGAAGKQDAPRPVKIAVVTGKVGTRRGPYTTVQQNVDYYLPLCESAAESGPDLILLPEVALQWGIDQSALDTAVPVSSPEARAFSDIAASHSCYLLLGLFERDGDAVHNTAALFGPDGDVEGRYHKVHLAVGGESESGILPGTSFPVFDTVIGRIGCNICMDSSAAESSRMVGLNGADLLLLPIMGDHRASRFTVGSPLFSESRWKAIMRTHAMDNQFCMVVARNTVQGSCIVDRKGEILAWNEGDQDWVSATVELQDGYRTWNGGCFRDVNWMQRRPHLYSAEVDDWNTGGSLPGAF